MTQLLVRTWQRIDKRCGEKKFYNGRPRVIKISWEIFIFFSGRAYHVNESRVAGEPTERVQGYVREEAEVWTTMRASVLDEFSKFYDFCKKVEKVKKFVSCTWNSNFFVRIFWYFWLKFFVKNVKKNNFFIKK